MKLRTGSILPVLAILISAQAFAQDIRLEMNVDTVFVGERFELAVVSIDPEGREVLFPDPDSAAVPAGDAEVIELRHHSFRFPGGQATGMRIDSAVYEVAVFAVDTAVVGGFSMRLVNASGDTAIVDAPYGLVPVYSVVPDSARGIYDLAPLALFPRNWWLVLLIAAVVAALLFLAGYGIARWRRNRTVPSPAAPRVRVDPYRDALDRLRKLTAAPAPASAEEVKAYYVELSDIVRTYLELRLSVPALEQTTGELEATFERLTGISSDVISVDAAERILGSLLLADLAKFARHVPLESENEDALRNVRQSIDSIEQSRVSRESLEAKPESSD